MSDYTYLGHAGFYEEYRNAYIEVGCEFVYARNPAEQMSSRSLSEVRDELNKRDAEKDRYVILFSTTTQSIDGPLETWGAMTKRLAGCQGDEKIYGYICGPKGWMESISGDLGD